MELIDSHAHLDMLKDPDDALSRAREVGVTQVVTIGVDRDSSHRAAELARRHENVFFTVGLHPHDAKQASESLWRELKALAQKDGAVAWGECGLDYYRNLSPRRDQRRAFARQIELALELSLPLVIHDRQAHQEVLDMLAEQDAGRVGGVVHCFSGDPALAHQVLDLGFHLGIDGPVTYPKNHLLREVVRSVPLERILLETDCPFLTPQPRRGRPNQPAYLAYVCQGVAEAAGCDPARVAQVTTANTRRLFRLPGGEAA